MEEVQHSSWANNMVSCCCDDGTISEATAKEETEHFAFSISWQT
jgi:hypothetical protein